CYRGRAIRSYSAPLRSIARVSSRGSATTYGRTMIDPRNWKAAFGYGGFGGKQTPLEERPVGKMHHPIAICSARPRGPIGTAGCVCLRALRQSISDGDRREI